MARAARLGPRREAVHDQRLGDVLADAHDRVERGHRLLEHEADAGAAHLPHLLFGQRQQIAALKQNRAAGDAAGLLDEPDDRKRRHRLAAARFADQPQRFALADLERHVVRRPRRPPAMSNRPCPAELSRRLVKRRPGSSRPRQSSHFRYSPNTARSVSAISPTVAWASTAAMIGGTRLSRRSPRPTARAQLATRAGPASRAPPAPDPPAALELGVDLEDLDR